MKRLTVIAIVLFFTSLAYSSEQMVEITVEITEINETKARDIGIEWPNTVSVNESKIPSLSESGIPSIFNLGSLERKTELLATLKVLETNEAARVLSNPKLVTKSGTRAKFIVGGEVPVLTTTKKGARSVHWKEYGIIVEITPTVLKNKEIDIVINTELSRLDYNFLSTGGYPAVSKRQALSHLQIKSGDTVVLAGLIETEKGKISKGIPFLSSIPILGVLFSINEYREIKKNILIFVTTKLIER